MTRNEERVLAFELLYENLFEEGKRAEEIYMSAQEQRQVPVSAFVNSLLACVDEHRADIDAKIDAYAVGWKRNRISKVSLAILTLAAAEIYYYADIPLRVSLNEAIELAKKYDDEKAYGFVNGVLNAMIHDSEAVGEA
jgi:N utilization substance protein B